MDEDREIHDRIADIKKPHHHSTESYLETVNLARAPKKDLQQFSWVRLWARRIGVVLGILLILGSIFFLASFNYTKKTISETADAIANNFSLASVSLYNFQPEEALPPLQDNTNRITEFETFLKNTHGTFFIPLIGSIVPTFKDGLSLFHAVDDLNEEFLSLREALVDLQENGLRNFQTNGSAFISSIERTHDLIAAITVKAQTTRNTISLLRGGAPLIGSYETVLSDDYLRYSTDLVSAEKFLSALAALLKEPGQKHIAVIFQDAGAARPGGGSTEVYGDLVVEGGQLQSIEVHDVYESDSQLTVNVVPPSELKSMTRKWGAHDAGWFFDFPTSAETFLYFLEHSKLYSEKNIHFEGAIAINTYALQNILSVTGPVTLEGYGKSISKDNFFDILEQESEGAAGHGEKAFIKALLPVLLEKTRSMDKEHSKVFMERFGESLTAKDIMFYARNSDIANFFSARNEDGGIAKLPNNFFGSYLAVANANVAGGKSDRFMEQHVEVRIDLDTSAGIFTDLLISRKHLGLKKPEAWWRMANRNFIQVMTNPKTSLVSVKGNDARNTTSRFDYDAAGYLHLPSLDSIELTRNFFSSYQAWSMEAFGKTNFGTWFNIEPGDEKTLEFRYELPALPNQVITEGKVFTFIFERQSGVRTGLKLTVSAPLGYNFKESGGPLYLFEDTGTAGRIVLPLTLTK